MGQVQTGSCPKCGAPIYCESPYFSILPPPPIYTCNCVPRQNYVSTGTTGTPATTTTSTTQAQSDIKTRFYPTDAPTTTDQTSELCGACGGKGYQMNIVTGINEVCLICGGTGKKTSANPIVTWLTNQSV